MKKNIIFLLTFILFHSLANGFDWPQETPTTIYSHFAQYRSGSISNSLVFSDIAEVKCSDNGFVTAFIKDYDDDADFFPSTLGNAVIVSHTDDILTVYANLDKETIKKSVLENKNIKAGENIAKSGDSAWQDGNSALEFQIIDKKNDISINPQIILSQMTEKETFFYPTDITLQNRNGRDYKIKEQTTFASGYYKVYQRRPSSVMPFKMQVFVNGSMQDEISFDLLRQDSLKLCVSGKKNYSKTELYPTKDTMLIGEVGLAAGKNTIRIVLADIIGKEATATYNVSNY